MHDFKVGDRVYTTAYPQIHARFQNQPGVVTKVEIDPADVLVAFDGIENPHSTPEVPGWYVPVACLVHWCDLETPADIERYLNA